MKYFLQLVAESLIEHVGTDLSRTVVIFPNKRACLFLNDYLMESAPNQSFWLPRYMTISEFFCSLTKTQIADPIDTVCRIYNHYVRLTKEADPKTVQHPSLDFFYSWGERLLSDFDDVDKNMGNAEEIFRDLKDYKEIESDDFLTEEQKEQLSRFLGDFALHEPSVIRERFLRLWRVLLPLYRDLRKELADEGLAYEGQLYRDVVEAMQQGKIHLPPDIDRVAFVGFNVLDKVEHTLFKLLKEKGKALFYWDYDSYYIDSQEAIKNEAGVFLCKNLIDFPNVLENKADFNNFLADRQEGGGRSIRFAEADSESIQAQYATQWLDEHAGNFDRNHARRTAIVLCNETLLQPVLHALPAGLEVNVTKGYPMGHTPAFASLCREMDRILDEQNKIPTEENLAQTLARLQEYVKQEASTVTNEAEKWLQELYAEAYFTAYTTLSRFSRLVEADRLHVRHNTLFRLVRQVLHSQSVPFHGEPAVGLQVMGVLETRCLDFDNVLMLSVNEGNIPQRATDASFIPFLIRQHYGLTTYVHKTSVFAYYFYRLLQRAKRVELTYNVSTSGTSRGEMSRFMRTMLIDGRVGDSISRFRLSSTPHPIHFTPDEDVRPSLFADLRKRKFSPTSLTTYINCHRSFYYKYVLGLKAPQTVDPLITRNDFGNVFHKAAQLLYQDHIGMDGRPITPSALLSFLNGKPDVTLQTVVREAFKEVEVEHKAVIELAEMRYLRHLLKFESTAPATTDFQIDAFVLSKAEKTVDITLDVPCDDAGKKIPITVKGTIDRLDKIWCGNGEERWRVIDYKTGGNHHDVSDFDVLFSGDTKESLSYPFQTFVYSLIVQEKLNKGLNHPIVPALYFITRMGSPTFTPYLTIGKKPVSDFRDYVDDFKKRLVNLLAEIIDPNNKFERTEYLSDHCKYCDFKALCGVKEKKY